MAPKRYSVYFAESAVRDLEEIARFVAVESPANARRLVERLRDRSRGLGTLPERGRIVPELAAFGIRAFREIVVRPYRIIYRPRDRDVLVLAVFDGRRDLEDVLLERLVRSGLP